MKRQFLGIVTLAAAASLAGAQPPATGSQPGQHATTHGDAVSQQRGTTARSRSSASATRRTTSSSGEVDLDRTASSPRAHPRDFVGADDTRCDDLCQRERMMDARYGKDRERKP